MRPRRFHGGLRLPAHAAPATARTIVPCALPEFLVMPLDGHLVHVRAGQRVRRGERLADAQDDRAAHLHAPASGHVAAIEARDTRLCTRVCILIAVDAADTEVQALPRLDWQACTPEQLVQRVRDAGIAGLGGAAFPSAAKLAVPCRLLILNGAACEPWIACDEALLRERADEIVQGGRALRRASGAQRVLLAIEDRMTEALRAVRDALARLGSGEIELVCVPAIYPAGGERQLIELLTGEEVPAGELPHDIGVLVQNVGTAAACWRAIVHGEPLLSRLVSVTGPGIAAPANLEVAFGTPLADVVACAGGYTAVAERLLVGGPMKGTALPHDDVPVDATTNCVLVLSAADVRESAAMPCIRCGDCAEVCPARLLPQQLHFFLRTGDDTRAAQHGLAECIECGCCDVMCPSNLPLAEQFRLGKAALRQRAHARGFADASRERYLARNARLARDAAERAAMSAAKAPSASDAVLAALERARKKREE